MPATNSHKGNDTVKKIALLGSAPSSVQLAPFNDPSWEIWGCSPGAYPHAKRVNAWFEIHRWQPPEGYTGAVPWYTPDYIAWMASLKAPVYMIEPVPQIPNSVAYPKDAMLEMFGPYFQTSSLCWMACLAVAAGAKEIGLWGVDMAAREEWLFQRTGLQCLLWYIHKHYGIKVTLPPESDLWVPPVLYGFCENDPQHIKLLRRKNELAERMVRAQQNLDAARNEALFVQGASDDNEYHLATWCQDNKARQLAFCQPAPFLRPDPVLDEIAPPVKSNGHHVEQEAVA
jgi:hypothetical protein